VVNALRVLGTQKLAQDPLRFANLMEAVLTNALRHQIVQANQTAKPNVILLLADIAISSLARLILIAKLINLEKLLDALY